VRTYLLPKVALSYGTSSCFTELSCCPHCSLCGTKCDIQAGFLNYLQGFKSSSTLYTNFTVVNVRIPLLASDAAAQQQQYATWSESVTGRSANSGNFDSGIDLISPRGEKAYDEQVRAWRLKKIQAFTHSHVKWAATVDDVAAASASEKSGEQDDSAQQKHQVGAVVRLSKAVADTLRDVLSILLCTQVSHVTKNIMHSFLSPYPWDFYQ
jgi:hypothetical protein